MPKEEKQGLVGHVFSNVAPSSSGLYAVLVTNAAGTEFSYSYD